MKNKGEDSLKRRRRRNEAMGPVGPLDLKDAAR